MDLRGKASKSNDITRTSIRGQAPATTPNEKKTNKREQGSAKKSREGRKKGLLEFFGGGPRVKAPSTDGTPIETIKNRRGFQALAMNPQKRETQADKTKISGEKNLGRTMRNRKLRST